MSFSHQQQSTHTQRAPPQQVTSVAPSAQRKTDSNPLWSRISQTPAIQRQTGSKATTDVADAGVPSSAGVPESLPSGPDACSTNEEENRKNAFRMRTFTLPDFIPSTRLGKFDASYWPLTTLMMATSKLHLKFVPADNTPDPVTLVWMLATGQNVSQFFWSNAEENQFARDFVNRTATRWSFQHQFRSTKPCWPFVANPLLMPVLVDAPSDAHFKVKVHKSTGPGLDYKSVFYHPGFRTPARAQGRGDLWGSDVQENANFNSVSVARNERLRINRAITAASASPIMFDGDSAVVRPAGTTALHALAVALNKKNPSAPAIPINLNGFASMEGGRSHNRRLSNGRAEAVRNILLAAGVTQPLVVNPRGPVGAPSDAANRRVDVVPDSTFEATYSSNRYSVAEHEFGHLFGLPDEYQNNTGAGFLATAQTKFNNLARQAGVDSPSQWGDTTASQMSAGVDVLPRHYVTLWEALGNMTDPDIAQNEWSIN